MFYALKIKRVEGCSAVRLAPLFPSQTFFPAYPVSTMKNYKDAILGYLIIGVPILICIVVIIKSCQVGGVPEELHPTRQYHGGGEQ